MAGLEALVAERGVLLGDGAMGTELFARGLTAGDPPEMWNIDLPDHVHDIHRGYIGAGSDIILTNSFGGTAYRLSLHGLEGRVVELNRAAASLARRAADGAERTVLVAGSMGPTGELLEPLGTMTPAGAAAAFAEQAEGLAEGGVDLLWIETMSSLDEVEAAVRGARSVCDVPLVATMSFDTAGHTMMGVSGAAAAERLAPLGLAALGANCGDNIADTERAVLALAAAAPATRIVAKANAGIPEWVGDRLQYSATPEVMGAHLQRMVDADVDIVGGCCGTTTAHIAYMRRVLDGAITAPAIAAPGRRTADRPERAPRASGNRRRRQG